MVHKPSLPNTLLLCLAFSLLLSSSLAVPSTRSIKKTEENPPSSIQDLLTQEAIMDMNIDGEELVDFGKMFIVEGRMDLESTDYPGTGANNHHDPKTPGRA